MTRSPNRTVNQLFDAYLARRATIVTPRTLARDRRALDLFRQFLDADGPVFLDETTGLPLDRAAGGIGACDLVDVEAIVVGVRPFLGRWLPEEQRGPVARVVRRFVSWLHAVGELDSCCALTLASLTAEHAPLPVRSRRSYRSRRAWGR